MVCAGDARSKTWRLIGCGHGEALDVPLKTERFSIGRTSDQDLQLDSAHVSKSHAQVIIGRDVIFVRDMGSSNGTFVNGRRITGIAPIDHGDRIQFADTEFTLTRDASTAPVDCGITGETIDLQDAASKWVFSQFDQLMTPNGVVPYYQPIVRLSDSTPIGYEALARSAVKGMENPSEMFLTAGVLNRAVELSCLCREKAAMACAAVPEIGNLFLNTHPTERLAEDLVPALQKLRKLAPGLPLTLEIHERCITSVRDLADFSAELTKLDIKLAYDDFGAGEARLAELVAVPLDYIKLDMSLIAQIDVPNNPMRPMIRGLVEATKSVGAQCVAEGVETAGQAEACKEVGIELAQGYYFGRPAALEVGLSAV